jgi:RNA polymerase sigma factor (sigma-70 family)
MKVEYQDVKQEWICRQLEGKKQSIKKVYYDMIDSVNWNSIITPIWTHGRFTICKNYHENFILQQICDREILKSIIKKLNKRQRIICGLYGIKRYTQKEVANKLHLERSTISKELKIIRCLGIAIEKEI